MEIVTNLGKNPENKKREGGGLSKELSDQAYDILNRQGIEAFEAFMAEAMANLKEADAVTEEVKVEAKAPEAKPQAQATPFMIRDITQTGNPVSDDISKVIRKAPVDQSSNLPTAKPVTLRDTIKILQPKSVVFAKYSLTEWQENILTLIMEQLQGFMSKSTTILKPDILGEISIRINTTSIAGDDKKKALAQIEKLMDYKFEFWWQNNLQNRDMYGRKVETKGHIVSTYHNYVGTPYVDLVINKWALPFLLYYGPGIGANRYLKSTALTLPGKYSKRLYKMLIGYIDKGSFDYRIEQMRKDFQIPDSYTTATIKRSIITPAVEAINEYAKGLHVAAEFIVTDKARQTLSKKPSYDTIRFTLSGDSVTGGNAVPENVMLNAVYTYLLPLVDKEVAAKLGGFCRQMQLHGDLGLVYSKIKFYDQKLRNHEINPAKLKNTLFKVIRESAGIELKPVRHRQIKTEK